MDWFAAVQWDDPEPLLVEAFATLFVWGSVVVAVLFLVLSVTAATVVYRRRRFWCVQAGRIAEVEFEEVGLPVCRRAVAVHSCSLFSPPTLVTCDRWCLAAEISARRPLTPPLEGGTQETDAECPRKLVGRHEPSDPRIPEGARDDAGGNALRGAAPLGGRGLGFPGILAEKGMT